MVYCNCLFQAVIVAVIWWFSVVHRVCEIPKMHFCLPRQEILRGLLCDSSVYIYFPGFPTFRHIMHEVRFVPLGVDESIPVLLTIHGVLNKIIVIILQM